MSTLNAESKNAFVSIYEHFKCAVKYYRLKRCYCHCYTLGIDIYIQSMYVCMFVYLIILIYESMFLCACMYACMYECIYACKEYYVLLFLFLFLSLPYFNLCLSFIHSLCCLRECIYTCLHFDRYIGVVQENYDQVFASYFFCFGFI